MSEKPKGNKAKAERVKAARAKQAERAKQLQRLKDMDYDHSRIIKRVVDGQTVSVLQVHVQPNPERAKQQPGYYCPAGPGLRPVPAKGRWYDLTDYMRKRLISGCVTQCPPPKGKE
jgi:hypothetical protein